MGDIWEVHLVVRMERFLGVHEGADGDTQLKLGEAAVMRNWMVTPQYHLKVRPGVKTWRQFASGVQGLWAGFVAGARKVVCVVDGGIYEIAASASPFRNDNGNFRRIGDISDGAVTMFGFEDRLYFLNGSEYLVWDGEGFVDTVEGYVPLVVTAMEPTGGGVAVENVNRLTGRRRCRFSADGTATSFVLPEQDVLAVEQVVMGEAVDGWRFADGAVIFETAPEAGVSNVEVWYRVANDLRYRVEGMRYAEQFNGAADTRVFLYGDGSAKAIYCGVTEEGKPSAAYFPDLYEVQIGSENAPVTGMIKYYDRLMSYKSDGGAYATRYELTTLADGSVVPGFLTVSINREIGNEAMGQVRLVQNVPRTFYGGQLYDWVMASYVTRDERNAKCIGQRVQKTLQGVNPDKVFAFDDDAKQEYYLFLNDEAGTTLVHQYGIDVWYVYTGLQVTAACRFGEVLLFGFADGRVAEFSPEQPNDDGAAIEAVFESGHLDFGQAYKRKHLGQVWVSVKPTAHGSLQVQAGTDREAVAAEGAVSMELATLRQADFGRWSFLTNRNPQMARVRLKVRRFVYLQLVLRSDSPAADTTVLAVELEVKGGGKVR